VTSPSVFWRDWTGAKPEELEWAKNFEPYYCEDNVNAYSVAELGQILPNYFKHEQRGYVNLVIMKLDDGRSEVMYKEGTDIAFVERANTEADARAKMLIYLLEEGLIKIRGGEIVSSNKQEVN
jgi:hypothetical protein